jgi:GT2 family glycosyltransferase
LAGERSCDHAHVENPALTIVLCRVLDGYERQTVASGTFELLVVSDIAEPDPDAVDRVIGQRPYPVRRLTGGRPGLSANRNTGWNAARAPIVLFTDNDCIPTPELVAEHLRVHERHPADEVAVTGPVRWAPGIRVSPFMKWLEMGIQFDFRFVKDGRVGWEQLYGANGSIKRSFLERVGGYDEERLPYLYEDQDWAYRASRHGLEVMFTRRALVDHYKVVTLESWAARLPQLAAAEWQFSRLHPEREPWFHSRFAYVAGREVGGRKAVRLARYVPPRTPWLGPLVWSRANLHWLKEGAPTFLAEWDRLAAGGAIRVNPGDSALAQQRAPAC